MHHEFKASTIQGTNHQLELISPGHPLEKAEFKSARPSTICLVPLLSINTFTISSYQLATYHVFDKLRIL